MNGIHLSQNLKKSCHLVKQYLLECKECCCEIELIMYNMHFNLINQQRLVSYILPCSMNVLLLKRNFDRMQLSII